MPRTPKFALTVALLLGSAGTASAEALTAQEQELVALVNQVRVDAGLAPLQADAGLAAVARAHSLDMATTGFFSHSSPTTGDMGDRLSAARVDFRSAGENIALNQDVRSAHEALVRSAPHLENIMNPDVTHIGVGIVSNGRSLLVTELFLRPGPRFAARIPTIDPLVAEASPNEIHQVQPRALPAQEGCEGDDDQEWDDDAEEDDASDDGYAVIQVQPGPGPITVVPVGPNQVLTPSARQIPMIQVRPMPMPTLPYPAIGRGYWILGPRGNWVQVRVQPAPIRQRIMPRTRSLF